PKRRALAAVYAFAREVDDIADEPGSPEDKRRRLEELRAAIDGEPDGSAMLVALADARGRFSIPDRPLHDLIDGGLQDLDQQRYADFDDLAGYCRRVAGAGGGACIPIFGAHQPQRAGEVGGAAQPGNL